MWQKERCALLELTLAVCLNHSHCMDTAIKWLRCPKSIYDKKIHGKPFNFGDMVWPWKDPFKVVERFGAPVYKIIGPKGYQRVHFDRLKPYQGENKESHAVWWSPTQPCNGSRNSNQTLETHLHAGFARSIRVGHFVRVIQYSGTKGKGSTESLMNSWLHTSYVEFSLTLKLWSRLSAFRCYHRN